MRLLELETRSVRGLADGAWRFDPDAIDGGRSVVVTGPPQAGLTAFLDAVALSAARLAFGGAPPAADVLAAGASAARIRTLWGLDAEERAYGGIDREAVEADVVFEKKGVGRVDADPALLGLMSRYDHAPTTGKVYLFPALRVADGAVPVLTQFEADQKRQHLSPDAGKFNGAPAALVRHLADGSRRAAFDLVQQRFSELSSSARLVGASPAGELEFTVASGSRVPLRRLSFAERNAFVFAALPVLAGLDRSVILVDTPELGLAPGVAARWVDVLRRATPGAQWIVASRDPAVVAGGGHGVVVDLGRRAT